MRTGLLEIDEMTLRAAAALPVIHLSWLDDPRHALHHDRVVVVQHRVMLESEMFDGLYETTVVFCDFGLYRLGPVTSRLIFSQRRTGLQ